MARLTTLLDRIATLLNTFGTILIVGIMALVVSDVVMRGALNAPLRGVSELAGMMIVALVFLQLPLTVSRGRMIRSELMLSMAMARAPRLGAAIEAIFRVIGALFFGAIAWSVWPRLVRAWESGTYVGASGDFTALIWPKLAVIVLGAGFAAAIYLALASRAILAPGAIRITGRDGSRSEAER